jgi:hypothetical protein
VKITRIYDDNGQSRFTDIDIPLNEREPLGGCLASGPPHHSLRGNALLRSPHGASWNRTRHHDANWLSSLSGEVEVETGDGDTRRFRPGEMMLADDTTGTVAQMVPVDPQVHINGNVAWTVGLETGEAKAKDGTSRAIANLVTNILEKTDGRWLLVSHHAQAVP